MKRILLALFFISHFSFAQNPLVKQWDYRYGGPGLDVINSFQETDDGGFILAGTSGSGIGGDKTNNLWGSIDCWVVKIDASFNVQWDKDFGGGQSDWLYSVSQTKDGGYILGGISCSDSDGNKSQPAFDVAYGDYWIIKIDSLGNKEWDKDFGGSGVDRLYNIYQTADGGYILAGNSQSHITGNKLVDTKGGLDSWIIKIDSVGNKIWETDLGGLSSDEMYGFQPTSDGGYIVSGNTFSGIGGDKTQLNWGQYDYWIIKIDSTGNKEWDKGFGGSCNDYAYSAIKQSSDHGYILGGYSCSPLSGNKTQPLWANSWDYWIIKTDSNGNKLWDKDFGGMSGEGIEYGNDLLQTSDKGYLIGGTSISSIGGNKSESNLGNSQVWLVKTDSVGNFQWDKTILTHGQDYISGMIETSIGCYVLAIQTDADTGGYKSQMSQGFSDYWIVKLCDTTLSKQFKASDNSLCQKFCTNFLDQSTNNPTSWQWSFPGGTPSSSTDQNPTNICYNTPGTYAVTLITTNAFGSDTLTLANYITVYSTPPFPTITQNGNVLTCSPAFAYQWQLNSADILGATQQSYTYTQAGLYTVLAYDSNGCSNYASVEVTGVENLTIDFSLSIYPNPSSGKFTVQWLDSRAVESISVTVENAFGHPVFSSAENYFYGKKEIDLGDVAGGVYFIELKTETKILQQKILIVH